MPKNDEESKIAAEVTLEMPVLPDPVPPDQDDPEAKEAKPVPVPSTQEECDQAVENSKRGLAALGIRLPTTAPRIKTEDDIKDD